MRKFAVQIIEAWRQRRSKKIGHYATDGTTVFAWSTPIATRALNGRRYVVDRTKGDMSNHLAGSLRATFPRAVVVARIDMFYSTIYQPTIHYLPRRPAHKIAIHGDSA